MRNIDRASKLGEKLRDNGDEAILIVRDSDTYDMIAVVLAKSEASIEELFAEFFLHNRKLIPFVLNAAATAMQIPDSCSFDCDKCDHTDDYPLNTDDEGDDIVNLN